MLNITNIEIVQYCQLKSSLISISKPSEFILAK